MSGTKVLASAIYDTNFAGINSTYTSTFEYDENTKTGTVKYTLKDKKIEKFKIGFQIFALQKLNKQINMRMCHYQI